MKFTIGFSPCPNDTFIFDALVNNKIDTGDFEFEPVLQDVESLNRMALEGRLDITKLSFPAFFQSLDHYTLLHAGSALGKGVGPLLIAKTPVYNPGLLADTSIAIPGIHTTANLLLSFAFPNANNKMPMVFSEIENAVLSGRTDMGVIIHENRFTYQQKGLHKIIDLGDYWEQQMQAPIPLGGIAINQSVKRSIAVSINDLIYKSLQFAFANYPTITDYVRLHAQEMNEDVMRQHIDLYVNEHSLDLGDSGRAAIKNLFGVYKEINRINDDEAGDQFFL